MITTWKVNNIPLNSKLHLYPSYVLIATNGYGFEHGLPPCFTTPTTTTLLQLLIHVILFLSYAFPLKIKDENIQFMQEIKKWRCVINVKL
jgi:hypothetical protein